MSVKKIAAIAMLAFLGSSVGVGAAAAANTVSNADELVAQHLDSIGSSAVRGGTKSRVVQGAVEFKILVGGAGTLDGRAQMATDGKKLVFMMKLPNTEYRGEQFVFDGDKVKVAFSTAHQTRSGLGNLIFVQDAALREGLWGGTLSTAWPLLNLSERQAKLSFEGLKKIDGEDLYAVRYKPRKSSDLEITLYFDPQTYHHVQTVYTYTSAAGLVSTGAGSSGGFGPGSGATSNAGSGPVSSDNTETLAARQVPNRYRLTEKFSDFKTFDGVTLPTHYDIQFSQEVQSGKTTLSDWDLRGLSVENNAPASRAAIRS